MKRQFKKGNTVLTAPFVLVISMVFITLITVFMVNTITPFIWYQKLQMVAHKYMYIVEKYGYLTDTEEQELKQELVEKGFSENRIKILSPKVKKEYGELIELSIEYNYEQKIPTFNGGVKMISRDIPLNVRKISISKI